MHDTSEDALTAVACALVFGGIATAAVCAGIVGMGLLRTYFYRWRDSHNG